MHLGRKVVLHLPSQLLLVWGVKQIHSDEWQLTPLRLHLVFRRHELQLVWLDQLHIQSYMHLHIHTQLY